MSPQRKAERDLIENERKAITDEAKVYVERLRVLMELVGEWAEEGLTDDVA